MLLFLIVVASDLWTKSQAFALLQQGERRTIITGFFHLVRVENQGAVGGLGGGHPWLLVGLRIAAVLVLLFFALRLPARRFVLQIAFALVLAGAIGNLYDNLLLAPWGTVGPVRDFLDFELPFLPFDIPGLVHQGHWNAFNIADSAIVCGALLLVGSSFFPPARRS